MSAGGVRDLVRFSKKRENLDHSVALHFFAYNFITRHGTIRMPPALRAGVTDHVWSYEELVGLIDRAGES